MKEKHKKDDHQIFDGGRPEFRNINERIFAALETDYEPLSDWETKDHLNLTTKNTDMLDVERSNLTPEEEDPAYHPL